MEVTQHMINAAKKEISAGVRSRKMPDGKQLFWIEDEYIRRAIEAALKAAHN